MPTKPLSPQVQGLMGDPYGTLFEGMPGFVKTLASMLLPNPQAPLTFGSITQPRGSFTSLVPKGGGAKGLPPTAILKEQLQQLASSPIAKDFGKPPDVIPHLETFLPTMESKELRELIDAYNSFLISGAESSPISGQPAQTIRRWTGPKRGKVRASMSYPSSEDVEHFVDYIRSLYMSPYGNPK